MDAAISNEIVVRRKATLDALVERIYPETPSGPGAARLDVGTTARRMADSATGRGEDWYRSGPFVSGTDRSRGWQWSGTQQQLLDDGLDRLDALAVGKHRIAFAALDTAQQEMMMAALEAGTLESFAPGVARAFFDLVHGYVFDALFVAPAVGSYSLDDVWQRLFPNTQQTGALDMPSSNG